ncbi:hypothetical protein [Tateyamaria sp.]|uniref:hypothetical protein n=1 Tax=Tateyamaria sp. TaxID=1929288 RepID=UPI003B2201CB
MPFDSSGVFQRLFNWRTDRDAGIKILAKRMDQEMDGIVAGINDIVQGEVDFKGPITGVYGTAAAPAFSFQEDTDTGVYRSGTNKLAASASGTKVLELRQDEVEALVNFKKGTFAIDGNFVSFEDGDHWITYNDGAGNFNIRVGNKYDGTSEVHTSNGHGAIHAACNHEQPDPEFKLRISSSGALGATVAWAKELVAKASGVLTWGGHTIWHAGNMGAGSTLDADRLDGQEGVYYRNASNLNAGRIANARLSGSYAITASNAVNADRLDGQEGVYYRNASNLNAGRIANARLSGSYAITASNAVNADRLDGQEGVYYRNASNLNAGRIANARLSGSYAITASNAISASNAVNADRLDGREGVYYRNASNLNAGRIANARLSGSYAITASNAVNADRLDGQEGVYYRNASNLNAGRIPAARLSGSYAITASNAVNADRLDGQEGVYYRNASNLNAGRIANARLSGSYAITASNAISASNADKVDNIHASSFVRRDNVNNGTVTIRVNDADFVVSDGTRNFIRRDHSANTLYLGTATAVPTLRANLDMNGQNVVGDLVSNNGDKIKSGAAYIENGHIVWEEGVNRITHNDGGGNANIRFGHEHAAGDKFTHGGTAFYIGGNLDAPGGSLNFTVADNGGAGTGQDVVWGDGLRVLKDDVRFAGVSLKAPLGNGQTWQNMRDRRTAGTTYQNTSGRAMAVAVGGWIASTDWTTFQVGPSASNLTDVATSGRSSEWRQNVFTVVPNGWWYRVPTGRFRTWAELS